MKNSYKLILKSVLDIILSSIALLILSPVLLLISVFLSIANKGKPFFFQVRPGKDEKIFKIIKFKTMTDELGSNIIYHTPYYHYLS